MTKRRMKGEGSVYKRGDGRIVGEYEDAYGKRRYISGKTKAEVRTKLRKLLADRDEGIAYDSENLTVSDYLDKWLEAVKGSVRERTWERHEQVVRLHLKPTIGTVKLDKLNALQVQGVYGRKLEAGLSPRSVEIIHATLHKALKQAVRWTMIPRNVAASATPPRPVRKEILPLSRERARRLLETARSDPLHAFYVLAVTTGMRNGELLGLQWKDVDLDAGTLRVRRTVWGGVMSPPKTAAGNRTIRLTGLAVAALWEHRLAVAKQRISEWVFPSRTGTPLSVHNVHNRSWEDNDTIRGGAGDDNVQGQIQDADEIYGQGGTDDLWDDSYRCGGLNCVDDNNLLDGGSGPDWLYGDNRLYGGPGDDHLDGSYAFEGKRVIRGGPGEDRITSSGRALDTIYVQDGERDTVSCGNEQDTVYFDRGIDSVNPINCERRISEPQ